MDPFNEAVKDFRGLYNRVTEAMEEYRDRDLTNAHAERRWLTDLIVGFENRYQRWGHAPTKREGGEVISALLAEDAGRLARMCGFAYLHVCLDLPVVISRSLPRQGIGPKHDLSIGEARKLYLALGPILETVYEKYIESRNWLSVFGLLRGAAWIDRRAIRALGYWVIMLRTAAWLHADSHREAQTPKKQTDYELDLVKRLGDGVKAALKLRWWQVLSALPIPILASTTLLLLGALLQLHPVTAFAANTILDSVSLFELVIVAVVVLFLLPMPLIGRLQVAYVNMFGSIVFKAMTHGPRLN